MFRQVRHTDSDNMNLPKIDPPKFVAVCLKKIINIININNKSQNFLTSKVDLFKCENKNTFYFALALQIQLITFGSQRMMMSRCIVRVHAIWQLQLTVYINRKKITMIIGIGRSQAD